MGSGIEASTHAAVWTGRECFGTSLKCEVAVRLPVLYNINLRSKMIGKAQRSLVQLDGKKKCILDGHVYKTWWPDELGIKDTPFICK